MTDGIQKPFLAGVIAMSFVVGAVSGSLFGAFTGSLVGSDAAAPTPSDNGIVKSNVTVEETSATIEAVASVTPSVVSVIQTQDLSKIQQFNPFGDFFFPFQQNEPQSGTQQVGAGTGFIVSSDGLILTNRHVADRENVDFTVIFNDGTEYKAQVLAIDPFNDLAVLKIEAKNLRVVELGDSDALKLGETVVAIGNALGRFQNTVTRGVVSGIDRTIEAGDASGRTETIEEAIQTDAAINQGNSGGPLINLSGQVVGINTAVSQEGQTIGFAIPINVAKQVVKSVQEFGRIVRPYLGVRYVLVNEAIKKENNLAVDYGALLIRGENEGQLAVIPGSPADKAGLEENDIILEFNGQKVTTERSLAGLIRKVSVGDTVKLKVLHDGEEKEVEVILEEYKEQTATKRLPVS